MLYNISIQKSVIHTDMPTYKCPICNHYRETALVRWDGALFVATCSTDTHLNVLSDFICK